MNSRRRNLVLRIAVLIAASAWASLSIAEESPIDALAPLIGQWHIDARWMPSGQPLKARVVFEWGPGKKFVISRTFITREGSEEYERYHEVFGVVDGKLVDHLFDYEGNIHTREFQSDGKLLKSEWKVEKSTEPTSIRQELEISAPDKLQWRIWLTRDGKTEQIMDGTWVKDASVKDPSSPASPAK
jgi:hypothetical protein